MNILLILLVVFTPWIYVMIMTWLSVRRAFKCNPYGYKSGIYYDAKRWKIVATKTPLHRDPKTGITYLGVTKKIG